jgi:maleate isomerase
MPYHFSPRGAFAIILPSTNAAVEAEFNQLLVPGVSFHPSRILIKNPDKLDSDEAFEQFMVDLRTEIGAAVGSVMTVAPDYMIMGMSSETFWGGKDGAAKFEAWMKELNGGLDVTTGAAACKAALEIYGAKRIGIVSPYQAIGDEQVWSYMTDMGFEVKAIHGLRCPTAISIAQVKPETLKDAFRSVDSEEVEALVQVGTNLHCGKVAAEMEVELDKPVIAVNVATLWSAYRAHGIEDKIAGWGGLFEKY